MPCSSACSSSYGSVRNAACAPRRPSRHLKEAAVGSSDHSPSLPGIMATAWGTGGRGSDGGGARPALMWEAEQGRRLCATGDLLLIRGSRSREDLSAHRKTSA